MGEFLVPLFVAFLDLHVRSGEYRRDIGAQKGGVTEHETGMAASVDRLEDVPVRCLYGGPPSNCPPKIWMKLASSANPSARLTLS